MQTISLCMIVKNEEEVLKRCLLSVRDAVDEIVIVDTGSTDKTREIAEEMGARVFEFEWCDDFSKARNYAFDQARMDYQMWIDADDILPQEQKMKLLELKKNMDGTVDIYMLPYCISFDEDGQPVFNYYRERIIRRAAAFRWEGVVHEVITPTGRIVYTDIQIHHYRVRSSDSDRNLRIYQRMLESGRKFNPREQFYYGSELYFHQKHAEAAEVLEQFLDSGLGWVENNITACRYIYQCRRRMGQTAKALEALARSFEWGLPRAEILCDLGGFFFYRQRYAEAAYWYKLALGCRRVDTGGGFIEADCYDFLPYMQLCVCCDRMGEREKAVDYNDRALRIKPNNPVALGNKTFFLNNP